MLAQIQALTLDTAGPLSEALEIVHVVDGGSDQVDLGLDRLVAALETDLIQSPSGLDLPELMPQLAVWPISRKSSMIAAFQRRLQVCCWPPGDPSQASLTTHTSKVAWLVCSTRFQSHFRTFSLGGKFSSPLF